MSDSTNLGKPRGWPLFLAGFVLIIAGPALYAYEFSNAHLTTPWYVPIMATLGVVLMAASLVRRMSILRSIGLVVFALFCGLQWFMFLYLAILPPYEGPAKPGYTLPGFAAKLADGSKFTTDDLERGKASVLIFYRGHW